MKRLDPYEACKLAAAFEAQEAKIERFATYCDAGVVLASAVACVSTAVLSVITDGRPGFLLWLAAALAVAPVAWGWRCLSRRWQRRRVARSRLAGRCPARGYDLRATPGRCPECGAVPKRA